MTETALAPVPAGTSSTPMLLLALESAELTGHFSALLRNAGYGVLPAAGPSDALRLLRAGVADLALLDVEWGAATVAALAESARTAARPCPVAVVVGWWDIRTGEVVGAADVLVYKPPTQRQLLSAIQPLLTAPLQERLPA